jgi:uncharacterized protein YjbJ (UPF0337 family)
MVQWLGVDVQVVKDIVMSSSTEDKVTGKTNEAIGNVKQGVGKAIGSEKLEAEGKIQEIKGKGQQAIGDVKDAVKDAVRDAT